ncbi:MAG TPA: carboxypeptidase-like regulatory domain-containing protein, partial [Flavisolibacter sp.]
MRRFILCIVLGNVLFISYARKITGTITDSAGTILPYASIQVKGTQLGTTANSEGRYALDLDEGSYTIICQHINYTKSEKSVIVAADDLTVDFSLTPQQFTMEAVIIRKGADPAEQIMRNTIARRQQHQDETGSFTCQVYTKGNLRVRSMPDKV